MRRPRAISMDDYIASLEARLRDEIPRIKRWQVPVSWRHPIKTLRMNIRPLLQGGAMVLTASSIIVAVGVAPATVTPGDPGAEMKPPDVSAEIHVSNPDLADRLLALNMLAVQEPDIPDTRSLNLE